MDYGFIEPGKCDNTLLLEELFDGYLYKKEEKKNLESMSVHVNVTHTETAYSRQRDKDWKTIHNRRQREKVQVILLLMRVILFEPP